MDRVNVVIEARDRMGRVRRMHNKKLCSLDELPPNGENILVADENREDSEYKDVTLKRCMFLRLGLQRACIRRSVLHHCIFQDCYCRGAKFEHVDFTGCHFKDCNLYKVSFVGCRLWYVRFSRCTLDYEEILGVIPAEPSIAIRLLRSLRQNAVEMGEGEFADRILRRQIEAEKTELKARFWARSKYYQDRFDRWQRTWNGLHFLALKCGEWLWGHGLRMRSILRTGSILICVFALLLWRLGQFTYGNDDIVDLSFWEAMYVSVVTFATLGYGDFAPVSSTSRFLCSVESLMGIVFLGFLGAAVYRRLSR